MLVKCTKEKEPKTRSWVPRLLVVEYSDSWMWQRGGGIEYAGGNYPLKFFEDFLV